MAAAKKKRKPERAFMKPVQPDAALSEGSAPSRYRAPSDQETLGLHQKEWLQDKKREPTSTPMTNSKRVFGGKKDRHHVRDDQAGQQTRKVITVISKISQGQGASQPAVLAFVFKLRCFAWHFSSRVYAWESFPFRMAAPRAVRFDVFSMSSRDLFRQTIVGLAVSTPALLLAARNVRLAEIAPCSSRPVFRISL